ncbi:1702_t:CDS:2, partial [Gigaspora margarita]
MKNKLKISKEIEIQPDQKKSRSSSWLKEWEWLDLITNYNNIPLTPQPLKYPSQELDEPKKL